jgi:hypothetical protein
MKKLFLLFLICINAFVKAQVHEVAKDLGSYAANFDKGNEEEEAHYNILALQYFLYAYQYDSGNANINFHIGHLYLKHPSKKHLAETYLEKAIMNTSKHYKDFDYKEKHAPLLAFLELGKAYHLDYKFDKALDMYNKYETYLKATDSETFLNIEHYKEQVAYAKQYFANPVKTKSYNLGKSINNEFPDFSPVISADEKTIIFTHRGPVLEKDELDPNDGWIFENVMISSKTDDTFPGNWSKPKPIGSNINSIARHEGSVGLTADGQTLIVYRDDNGDGNLYYSKWNGSEWSLLTAFNNEINSKHWEPSACLSNDGNSLYFVSDRPGGFGGRDIYVCKKLPNGNWAKPKNMGPEINTHFDEESPFLSVDDRVLYFASQGHNSMGGFDIVYVEVMDDGHYSKPKNIGYPINTTDDDLYFVVSPDGKRGYYSSSHEGGEGEKDLYMLEVELPEAKNLVLYKGKVVPAKCDSMPDDLTITLQKSGVDGIYGIYRPSLAGFYSIILKANEKYIINYESNGVSLRTDSVFPNPNLSYQIIEKEIELKPLYLISSGKDTAIIPENFLLITGLHEGFEEKHVKLINIKNQNQPPHVKHKNDLFFHRLLPNSTYVLTVESPKGFFIDTINLDCRFRDTIRISPALKPIVKSETHPSVASMNTNPSNSVVIEKSEAQFIYFFKYNINNIEQEKKEIKDFLDAIRSALDKNMKVEMDITSSASRVPTKKWGSNQRLSKSRLDETKNYIKQALGEEKYSKIKWKKQKSKVDGPAYKNDRDENMQEYEKYQFVELKARMQ